MLPTRYYSIHFLKAVLVVLAGVIFIHANAFAQCVPGLPCVTGATTNDPEDYSDGPSVAGAPNANKLNFVGTASKPATCDADLLNQMYSRAYLEARREVLKSETIIRKPDSVLEYSCFDQAAQLVIDEAAPIFSESTRWHPAIVPITSNYGPGVINLVPIPSVIIDVYMGPGKMELDIEYLVLQALDQYIDDNFSHTFLGGSVSLDYSPSGPGYNCSYMDEVYQLSKCNDFGIDDAFWSFDELISFDPRALPEQCDGGTGITQDLIDLSENKDFEYVEIEKLDPTYVELFDPTKDCAPPIETGLMISKRTRSTDLYGQVNTGSESFTKDMVCPTPNCYYTGTTCQK